MHVFSRKCYEPALGLPLVHIFQVTFQVTLLKGVKARLQDDAHEPPHLVAFQLCIEQA